MQEIIWFNLHNLTSDSTIQDKLYLRAQSTGARKKNKKKMTFLVGLLCILIMILSVGTIFLLFVCRRMVKRRKAEEDSMFKVTKLRVFSYKELHVATKGFSEKLGHGGFGAVFRGVLLDSSLWQRRGLKDLVMVRRSFEQRCVLQEIFSMLIWSD